VTSDEAIISAQRELGGSGECAALQVEIFD
jgi:hypothetical protein